MLVLDLATEDFIGPWDIAWRARAVEDSSGSPVSDSRLRAEVAQLRVDGFLAVYKGVRFDGDESELGLEEARSVIADPANWHPAGTGEQHYRVAATERGEAEYRRRYRP